MDATLCQLTDPNYFSYIQSEIHKVKIFPSTILRQCKAQALATTLQLPFVNANELNWTAMRTDRHTYPAALAGEINAFIC